MHHINPVASVRGECGKDVRHVRGRRSAVGRTTLGDSASIDCRFSSTVPAFVPLDGFPKSVNDTIASLFPTYAVEVATFMEALSGSGSSYLSTQAVVVTLGSDLFSPFSFEVVVDNPSADPEQNYWRLMVLDAEGKTLQTNERSWTCFPLSGTFSWQGELIVLTVVHQFFLVRQTSSVKTGRATSLVAAGSPIGVILAAGEWKSSAFLRYCQADEISVSAVLEVVCAKTTTELHRRGERSSLKAEGYGWERV